MRHPQSEFSSKPLDDKMPWRCSGARNRNLVAGAPALSTWPVALLAMPLSYLDTRRSGNAMKVSASSYRRRRRFAMCKRSKGRTALFAVHPSRLDRFLLLETNPALRMEVFTAEILSPVRSSVSPSADGVDVSAVEHARRLRLLLVEDNPADVELELLTLQKDGFDVSGDVAQTAEEFTTRIRSAHYDLILADYNLPQWRGTETLEILCRENLDIPLIIVTGYLGEEKAVDYIKQGATDCVL